LSEKTDLQGFQSDKENLNVLQFDPDATIKHHNIPMFPVKCDSLVGDDSSDNEDDHVLLMNKMNSAMAAGDYTALAALAGNMSVSEDDFSTSSSQFSYVSDISGRHVSKNCRQENPKRSAKIDELIGIEEWTACGTTPVESNEIDEEGMGQISRKDKSKLM